MGTPSASSTFRLGYRPSLDGLRAFAVLAVMAHHAGIPHMDGGSIGVDVFFVLSGFLITQLLIEEWQRSSSLNFRNFYLRRALRLLPALIALLLAYAAFALLFMRDRWHEFQVQILAALFYSANWLTVFHPYAMGSLRHTWSLSVEEQFYLIWPLLLFLLLRTGLRGKRLFFVILVFTAGVMLYRVVGWRHGFSYNRIYNGLDTRFDSLLTGCATAIFCGLPFSRRLLVTKTGAWLLGPAMLVLFLFVGWPPDQRLMVTWGWPCLELAVAVAIFGLVTSNGTLLHKAFELPVMVWIGRLSYALYLWHFPLFSKLGGLRLGVLLWPAMFLCAFVAAVLSYFLIEQPFLGLKSKLTAQPAAVELPLISRQPPPRHIIR